jgi:hypothetical protein
MEEWLLKNDFKPVVNHRFNLREDLLPNWNGVADCRSWQSSPKKKLSYTSDPTGDDAARRYASASSCARAIVAVTVSATRDPTTS